MISKEHDNILWKQNGSKDGEWVIKIFDVVILKIY